MPRLFEKEESMHEYSTAWVERPVEYARLRERMVEEQLRARGIHDERVLDAMATVPRQEFVPPALREAAYDDGPLPIGHGQTISQPFTVALMCEALRLGPDSRVLEIGTGSGYGAAVLSRLCRFVYSLELVEELVVRARERLVRLGFKNVAVRQADGTRGLPGEGPYDGIVVTAAAAVLPLAYLDQLDEGGRLVIPVGGGGGQTLYLFTRRGGGVAVEALGGFRFVPLVGELGDGNPATAG